MNTPHTPEQMDRRSFSYGDSRRLGDSEDHIIPGHDPMVMQLNPALSPDLECIAVRLDVAPRER